jgi:hypothetical protein
MAKARKIARLEICLPHLSNSSRMGKDNSGQALGLCKMKGVHMHDASLVLHILQAPGLRDRLHSQHAMKVGRKTQ